jgi:uncharacterized membrane protein
MLQQTTTSIRILLACMVGWATSSAHAAYTVTDLGVLPGWTDSQAYSINNYGQVVGTSSNEAFLWTPDAPNGTSGSMISLGAVTSSFDNIKINNYGQVIYYYNIGTYLWTPNTPNGTEGIETDIGGLVTGFRVSGIGFNNVGQISGYAYPGVCFLWTPSVPNGTTGAFNSYFNGTFYEAGFGNSSYGGEANAINDSGLVTGSISTGPFFPLIHADPNDHYLTSDAIPLFDPPNYTGTGWAINAAGHVAGTVNFPATFGRRPFLYDGSSMIDITSLESGTAYALNNSDDVVGKAIYPIIGGRPFLYSQGTLFDLNDLLPPDSGWTLTDVFGINDAGQMVGYGYHAAQLHAFLLSPQ